MRPSKPPSASRSLRFSRTLPLASAVLGCAAARLDWACTATGDPGGLHQQQQGCIMGGCHPCHRGWQCKVHKAAMPVNALHDHRQAEHPVQTGTSSHRKADPSSRRHKQGGSVRQVSAAAAAAGLHNRSPPPERHCTARTQGKVLIVFTGRALPGLELQTCLCHLCSLLHLDKGQHLGHKPLQAQGRPLSIIRCSCRLVPLQCKEL